jgi:hypothetical protein
MRTVLAVAAAIGSLPHAGTLVPGRSLGGIRLGEPAVQVSAALGAPGVCDGCGTTTWYFTYRKFTNPGLAVELKAGRVTGMYTVWRPHGWHTPAGLRLGAPGTRRSSTTRERSARRTTSWTGSCGDSGS